MLTIHHLNESRSHRIIWLAEELGIPYRIQQHWRDPKTMLAPDSLRRLHPLGKAPMIEQDGQVTAETGAIIETMAAGSGLRPDGQSDAGRAVTYWLHYAEGSAMPPLVMSLVLTKMVERSPAVLRPLSRRIAKGVHNSFTGPDVTRQIGFWDQALQQGKWFAGDHFTVADVAMSFPIEMAALRMGVEGHPAIRDWLRRIHARPAYDRALKRGGAFSGANAG